MKVYAEMLPCNTNLADLPFKPKGVVLSGGNYLLSRLLDFHANAILSRGCVYRFADKIQDRHPSTMTAHPVNLSSFTFNIILVLIVEDVDPAVFELGVPILGIWYEFVIVTSQTPVLISCA